MIRQSTAIYILKEEFNAVRRFGIGHVLQIISDPPSLCFISTVGRFILVESVA